MALVCHERTRAAGLRSHPFGHTGGERFCQKSHQADDGAAQVQGALLQEELVESMVGLHKTDDRVGQSTKS